MTAILEGVRVLDFGRYIAGPFCGSLLAHLGAEVIRIEAPEGADDRYIMPVRPDGEGALYLHANRGKKAITLDTRKDAGRSIARRMIEKADVVIANFSPSALTYFGLDYETVRAIKPDIILTTVSAFGSDGPLKDAVGFDGVGQAVSGAIHLTGEPGKPTRSVTAYVDFSTALSCTYGTLAALIKRMRTGEGSHVQASLVGTALNIMNPILVEHASGQNRREPTGNRAPIAGPSDIFQAKDGWFIMQVQGPKMFKRWAVLVGRPELTSDPRFADDALRGRNGAELSAIMQTWAQSRTRAECLKDLEDISLAAEPALTPDEILGDALGLRSVFMDQVEFPGVGPTPMVSPPISFSPQPLSPLSRAPALGEHTREVLARFGFTRLEVDTFERDKVI
jgi:crotonobetainyl-CoA:carnitine CoA-transferase CaiB-like acyl-CoA transferase